MTDDARTVGFVEAFGAPLSYEIAGEGPALVLLHEGLADSRMFDPQFEAFAERHRVIRCDLHGFGRSGTPSEPYTHHDALRQLLARLGIERASLLGMSLGGGVAVDFAIAYPGMVEALLPVAAGVSGWVPTEAMNELFAPLMAAFQAGDFVRAIDLTIRIWVDGPNRPPDAVDPAIREQLRAWYAEVLRRSREGARPADQLAPPAIDRLGEVRAKTLVIAGAEDVPDVLAQAEMLAREIPGAQRAIIPDAAHVLNLERPEAFNRLVLDFLAHAARGEQRFA